MSREEFFRPQRPVATFPYDSCLRGWLEARRNPLEERRYALGERRYPADTRTSPLPKQYRSSPQAVQVLSPSSTGPLFERILPLPERILPLLERSTSGADVGEEPGGDLHVPLHVPLQRPASSLQDGVEDIRGEAPHVQGRSV